MIYDRTRIEQENIPDGESSLFLNGTTRLYPNFNYSRSASNLYPLIDHRIIYKIRISVSQSITVHINLSRKHCLFRENLIHYRVFLGQFEVNEPLEKDADDTFLRQPQGIVSRPRYRQLTRSMQLRTFVVKTLSPSLSVSAASGTRLNVLATRNSFNLQHRVINVRAQK